MLRRLLTVEDTFQVTGRGLIVVPGPLVDDYQGARKIEAELRKPDGSVQLAELTIGWTFQTPPPKELRWTCSFNDVSKGEVPIGTEIWIGMVA